MQDYYPLVKKTFAYSRGIKESDEEFKVALLDLNRSLDWLRNHYRTYSTQEKVKISYENETADAYLLGYIPLYVTQAKEALKFSEMLDAPWPPTKVAFFCCGPCPEGIALMELLNDAVNQLPAPYQKEVWLELYLFDRDEATWRTVTNSLLSTGEHNLWPGTILTESYPLDLTETSPSNLNWLRAKEVVGEVDVVMFQNCFNEFGSGAPLVEEKILSIAKSLPHNAKLLISELQRTGTVDTFARLKESLSQFGATRASPIFPTQQVKDRTNRNVKIPGPCAELRHTFFANQDKLQTTPRTGAHCIFLTLDRDRMLEE